MVDLLFLGFIPGTHIQISFEVWLLCLALVAEIVGSYYIQVRLRPVLTASIYISAWRATRAATSRLA